MSNVYISKRLVFFSYWQNEPTNGRSLHNLFAPTQAHKLINVKQKVIISITIMIVN